MEMHPHFTEIPRRSLESIRLYDYLSEALLALITNLLEAEDVARSIREIYETKIELVLNEQIVEAPISLADFADLGLKVFESMKITVSQWVMTTENASDALHALTMWDRRFGVWCACQVAREALRYVPEGEKRPLRAIETAEAWVTGKATMDDVRAAYQRACSAYAAYAATIASYDNADATTEAIEDAYYAATNAAYSVVAYAAYSAGASAAATAANVANANVADAADDPAEEAAAAELAELSRLREVVANACLSFPA